MEMGEKSLEHLKRLTPRQADDTVRQSVLANPRGASSEDMLGAFAQVVEAGILSWEDVERFEEVRCAGGAAIDFHARQKRPYQLLRRAAGRLSALQRGHRPPDGSGVIRRRRAPGPVTP